jgi:hypothetical protein
VCGELFNNRDFPACAGQERTNIKRRSAEKDSRIVKKTKKEMEEKAEEEA